MRKLQGRRTIGLVLLAGAAFLPLGGVACERSGPCGWDTVLEQHDRYEVTLDTAYTEASWPAYDPSLAVYGSLGSLSTCEDLDEFDEERVVDITLTSGPTTERCGRWWARIDAPAVELDDPSAAIVTWGNEIVVAGTRDFGDGCRGAWIVAVHLATGDDPYAAQDPEGAPIVLTYRVFQADGDAADACATRTGLTASGGALTCGDAFVSTMRAVE